MMDTLHTLPVPRVDAACIRRWFGEVKEFPEIDHGAPVLDNGQGDLPASLACGNNNSIIIPFMDQILEKIVEDVLVGRAFVFPRAMASQIPGIRVSPLTGAVSSSKIRICMAWLMRHRGAV